MNLFADLHALQAWGLLALRIAVAAIFWVHGTRKRAMWKMQPSEQLPAPMLKVMKILSIAEPLGALGVFLGFLTQLAGLGLAVIMAGAIRMKVQVMKVAFAPQNHPGWEFDLILLGAAILLFFAGGGSLSLDRLIFGL